MIIGRFQKFDRLSGSIETLGFQLNPVRFVLGVVLIVAVGVWFWQHTHVRIFVCEDVMRVNDPLRTFTLRYSGMLRSLDAVAVTDSMLGMIFDNREQQDQVVVNRPFLILGKNGTDFGTLASEATVPVFYDEIRKTNYACKEQW